MHADRQTPLCFPSSRKQLQRKHARHHSCSDCRNYDITQSNVTIKGVNLLFKMYKHYHVGKVTITKSEMYFIKWTMVTLKRERYPNILHAVEY